MDSTARNRRSAGAATQVTSQNKKLVWLSALLLASTIAIYSPVANHDFLSYDDPDYVTQNPHVRAGFSLAGIRWAFTSGDALNWHPLTWLSHMLDVQIFGMNAGAQHMMSVVLHAISAILLLGFLARTTGAIWQSFFVAFVFALHPLHIESAAWIAERKDVLCALFWMLTLWAYLFYTRKPSASRYTIVLLAFACALMSKAMAVTLPIALLLIDVWPLRRIDLPGDGGARVSKRVFQQLLIEKIPLLILSIAASMVAYFVQQRGTAVIALSQISLPVRLANACESYVLYIAKLFWPSNLAVLYPFPQPPHIFGGLLSGVLLLALTILAIRVMPRAPYVTVGWLWYLSTLAPVIGIVQIGLQSHADRYTYLPMIGISIALAWGIPELFRARQWNARLLAAAASAACASWTFVTWNDLDFWRDNTALFARTVEVTDRNYIAYANLGNAMLARNRVQDAIECFTRSLAIQPDSADLQLNLGSVLLATARVDEGRSHLETAVQLFEHAADSPELHYKRGRVYQMLGRDLEASEQYKQALRMKPNFEAAAFALDRLDRAFTMSPKP